MFKSKAFYPNQSKDAGGQFPPGMRNWILPPWFRDQNNPLKTNYIAGQTAFYNYCNRNWTSLRVNPPGDLIQVDSFGSIYLVKYKISIEIWVYHETRLYTPGTYVDITQEFSAADGGINVNFGLKTGHLPVKIGPISIFDNQWMGIRIDSPVMRQSAPESAPQSFEPIMVWLVVRPFGPNGLTKICRLEYKDHYLTANRQKILRLEDEPQHCFFTNAAQGDVTQYFRLWEGNSKIEAVNGSCTGMIGFSAVPANWRTLKIAILDEAGPRYILNNRWLSRINPWFSGKGQRTDLKMVVANTLRTGTGLDELYTASLRHLATFYQKRPVNIYQVLVFNRLGLTIQSRACLTAALKKVRWDGSLARQYLGGNCVLFAVADYYKITGDRALIEKYWPVLKRVGFWVCYQSGLTDASTNPQLPQSNAGARLEHLLWLCGSLQAIAELGTMFAKNREVQIFKSHFCIIWAKLFEELTAAGKLGVQAELGHNQEPGGEMAIRGLMASFPLQLSEKGAPPIEELLRRILARHLWQGGFFSPQDFQGVDLDLTARLGQVLIREGMDYHQVFNFLLHAVSPTLSWPDRINPLSKKGIGEEGHDPGVLYQMLLMIRSLFLIEDSENLHLLPGVFISRFWQAPNLELRDWPTYFGSISVKVRTIGGITQINFEPKFRRPPQKIILTFSREYRLLYTDTNIQTYNKMLFVDPNFQVLRVLNNACLDNTFGHTL